GCAIGNAWLREDHDTDRFAVLTSLGLEPTRPTLYHNARYAVDHKGQVELIRAVDRLLAEDEDVNVIIRCMSSAGIPDPLFHAVAARYAGRVHLEWEPIDEASPPARARSSGICLFRTKFDLDTFHIAKGEDMLDAALPFA